LRGILPVPFSLKELKIRTRVVVLALFLAVSLIGVGLKTYWVWQEGPWSLPAPAASRPAASGGEQTEAKGPAPAFAGTEVIIAKNLFDPERGANSTQEAEADTRAAQRIRNLVLLGTAILGANRYAIIQDSDGVARPATPGTQPVAQVPRRVKLGDSVDGFNLAEVAEKKVVFAKGAMRVEVPVDYFRKVPVAGTAPQPQPARARLPGPVNSGAVPGQIAPAPTPNPAAAGTIPRVVPNLPRRPRLPNPPEQ
jgi:hypothetical protein